MDAGIAEDLVFGDPKAPRFVFWNKKLRPTPSGPDVLTFDLLSIWGKIRAGLGAAGVKKPLPGQPPPLQLYAFSPGLLCALPLASCRAIHVSEPHGWHCLESLHASSPPFGWVACDLLWYKSGLGWTSAPSRGKATTD